MKKVLYAFVFDFTRSGLQSGGSITTAGIWKGESVASESILDAAVHGGIWKRLGSAYNRCTGEKRFYAFISVAIIVIVSITTIEITYENVDNDEVDLVVMMMLLLFFSVSVGFVRTMVRMQRVKHRASAQRIHFEVDLMAYLM